MNTAQRDNMRILLETGGRPARTMTVAAILAAAWFVPAAAADDFNRRHFGLSVGIDQYAGDVTPLSACVNDANGFRDALLGDPSRWSAADIEVLTNSSATLDRIRDGLWNMGYNSYPGDVCVYFHSSHGGSDYGSSAYLFTHESYYSDEELGADLANFFSPEVTVIVVVDACNSGGMFKSAGSDGAIAPTNWAFAENVMAAYLQTRTANAAQTGERFDQNLSTNIGFLTASDYWELSNEGWSYGQFTGELLAAFDQATDADGDGHISFWELYSWAAPRASYNEQTPQAFNEPLLSRTIASSNERIATAAGGACGLGAPLAMLAMLAGMFGQRSSLRRRYRWPRHDA